MRFLGRRRWDPPPTTPASVLLASTGAALSDAAVGRAAQGAGGETVAVVIVARLHGYAFGMPNPGLLPTKREKQTVRANLEKAIGELRRLGTEATGEIAITRSPAKVFARAALAQGVRLVVMDPQPGSRLRRSIEGDLAAALRRRLRSRAVDVVVV